MDTGAAAQAAIPGTAAVGRGIAADLHPHPAAPHPASCLFLPYVLVACSEARHGIADSTQATALTLAASRLALTPV